MKIFDFILQDSEATEDNARAAIHGLDWQEIEITEQDKPYHSRFVFSDFGINVYYDYCADYYFFEDISED